MFRKLVRSRQEIPYEECIGILKEEKRGILSVLGDDDYPYGVPLDHYYSEEDGCLYFHSGKSGHKTDAMKRHDKVSYCVMDQGHQEEGEWFLRFRSVIVFGRIEKIEEEEIVRKITYLLSRKFTDDEAFIEEETRQSLRSTVLYRLKPEHICGKRIREL